MRFHEVLNVYLEELGCTAKELSEYSGLSAATLSRYRSGERVPERCSEAMEKLCAAIVLAAQRRGDWEITTEDVGKRFRSCPDVAATDRELLRQNFNALVSALNINISRLCRHTNYDASTIFRIRNGTRQPAEPEKFAAGVAAYVARELDSPAEIAVLAGLLGCSEEELADSAVRFGRAKHWLTRSEIQQKDSIPVFLEKLDAFDLHEYAGAIRFDALKVPSVPFQLPTTKTYTGLKQMKEGELDFLRSTILSKSAAPVLMYSDMPIQEMSKDAEFSAKWMTGMAMLLKKGLHLNLIHNVDRPFSELILGLESYIPMYMTGQVSPCYLKGVQNNVFLHLLRTSGAAALTGEAISGHYAEGRYNLTKSREEVAYYNQRAEQLLENASPLMKIYRAGDAERLNAFLREDAATQGKRRSIRSAPPLYTMDEGDLKAFLRRHSVPDEEFRRIVDHAAQQRRLAEEILKHGTIQEEVPHLTEEEFENNPMTLPLSGLFMERELRYSYADYLAHLEQTERFAQAHPTYRLERTATHPFCNLQIILHEGQWAMISKRKAPAIHFVIHHPKIREAIESFVPPIAEI